ncbi:MAG: 30S ribosomal protein S6 [Candidatus Beckwithbacteria bacterium GW2011_GWA2_43_10]|uniref:Small ribosomal subunit protein bS6 n=1 Tax=Candidatus Beckwithbacteria bacterium GW2011_GWA2_43_10 TaxID=1618369 RepID=A0A0G1C121_9BACT|nr:MAG: 30S ribosomal protein S6 [Candidatus Beckwithbacteria bacterium GW2011_GWA2_43_10]
MSRYELALVLREGAGKDEILSKVKGKITSTNSLGLKPLSYPVKKTDKGQVLFLEIEMAEVEVKSLEQSLKINEQVLRYLIIKKE